MALILCDGYICCGGICLVLCTSAVADFLCLVCGCILSTDVYIAMVTSSSVWNFTGIILVSCSLF